MRIAVIGAGAIGGLVAGYLKHRGEDVFLVGRKDALEAIKKNDLHICGSRGNLKVKIGIFLKLEDEPQLAILAVKTQDIEKVITENLKYLKSAAILTTQNGIRADSLTARYLPKENIISSIVMFGSTYLEPGKIVHNFDGNWILGRPFTPPSLTAHIPHKERAGFTEKPSPTAGRDERLEEISAVLSKIFPVITANDISGMKWLKVFVNANNCLPAILGKSMQETFGNLELCRLSMRIWQEGLTVVKRCGIKLVSLPDFPQERLTKLASLPLDESAKIFSGIMTNLSRQPLYGSILQSIKRNRPSEIDYINGEFVALAKTNGVDAKLNERLVNLVHKVERSRRFLTAQELIEDTKEFLS